jgi:hypothetical protein
LLKLFDFKDIDHLSYDFLEVSDLCESFFELLPDLLGLICYLRRMGRVFYHLGFKFHFLGSLFFDGVLENEFLLFEVVDLGLESVYIHGCSFIGCARVKYFFL